MQEYITTLNEEGGVLDITVSKEYKPREGGNSLRLSSSGHCGRKLAYANLLPMAETLSPRTLSIFMLGDILHDTERHLISQVADIHSMEKKLYFQVDDTLRVGGHCDGIIELKNGPALLDIKTTNDRSFSEMLSRGISYEYRAQLNAYMDAAGLEEAYLWAYNKNTSERAVLPVEYDARLVEEVRTRFRRAHGATLDSLPPRDYEAREQVVKGQKTGNLYLDWHCTYCPFVETCWGEEGFVKVIEKGKPRFVKNEDYDI